MSRSLFAVVALAVVSTAHAVPLPLTFTGNALDTSGTPISGTHAVTLELWDAATDGTRVFQQSFPSVELQQGAFTVQVSPDAALLAGERWLALTVDGGVVGPRTELTEAPVAVVTREVHALDGSRTILGDGTIVLPSTAACEAGALRYDSGVLELCGDDLAWHIIPTAGPGQSASTAAASCKSLRQDHSVLTSGLYWVDPTGSDPYRTYCDMVTNGGGWTLCGKYDRNGSGSRYLRQGFGRSSDNRDQLALMFSFSTRQASADCRAFITGGATQFLSAGSDGALPFADGRINDLPSDVLADPTNLFDLDLDEAAGSVCTADGLVTRNLSGASLGRTDGGNSLAEAAALIGNGTGFTNRARTGASFSNAARTSSTCEATSDDTVFWSWRDVNDNADDHGCGSPVFGTGCSTTNATYRYNFLLVR